jgi:hypothetical protein
VFYGLLSNLAIGEPPRLAERRVPPSPAIGRSFGGSIFRCRACQFGVSPTILLVAALVNS